MAVIISRSKQVCRQDATDSNKFVLTGAISMNQTIEEGIEGVVGGAAEGTEVEVIVQYNQSTYSTAWEQMIARFEEGNLIRVTTLRSQIPNGDPNSNPVSFDTAQDLVVYGTFSESTIREVAADAGGVLTGEIKSVAFATAPQGYLSCDGSAVSRTTYATLFAAIGTTYGSGDGTTTFNVPDLRGEFLRGWDNGRGVDSGRSLGSTQGEDVGVHGHTATVSINSDSHSHTASTGSDSHSHTGTTNTDTHDHGGLRADPGTNAGTSGGSYIGNTRLGDSSGLVSYTESIQDDTHSHTFTTDSDSHNHSVTVDSDSHNHTGTVTVNDSAAGENRPRNVTVNYIIKT